MSKGATVLFIWDVSDRLKLHLTERLGHLSNVQMVFPSDASPESLVNLASKVDIMVGWRPTRELLLAAEQLSLFINPGAGVQHLIDLFREVNQTRQVLLANCHGNANFVAQHAVALLLALMNKIIPHHNWMAAGRWREGDEAAKSSPLPGRSVGLLGYGAVNQTVHKFLSGFDVEFSILRRTWNKHEAPLPTLATKFRHPELQTFLKAIDTLIVAVPLTRLTRNLIGEKELGLIGPEGFLVNLARGSVINEGDLYTALKNQVIAGAAIDVWYNYHPDPDDKGRKYPFSYPFHELPNVVMSPHRAASPMDDLRRWDDVIQNIERFAQGTDEFKNLVNLEQEY